MTKKALDLKRGDATPMSALRKPSDITEPGWYWAEERIEGAGIEDSVYERCVVAMVENVAGAMLLEYDGATYDAAAADAWFRIIRRIDEPEITGGGGMKLYALRHTRTGKLMPLRSSGKGYTWWEPSQLADGAIHVPRLFTAKRSASLARSWWVKGGADIEYVGDFDDVPEPRIVCKPMGRTEHDMEVVEIGLEVAA